MGNGIDKRLTSRIPHQAAIRYCSGDVEDYRPARMYNYSTTGMYLELGYPPPKLGEQLLIEVLDMPPDSPNWSPDEAGEVTACYYAKVIWKKNIRNSPQAEYGVGLCYLHPPLDD